MKIHRRSNSPLHCGKLVIHSKSTFSQGVFFSLFFILYMDDKTFNFESRDLLLMF